MAKALKGLLIKIFFSLPAKRINFPKMLFQVSMNKFRKRGSCVINCYQKRGNHDNHYLKNSVVVPTNDLENLCSPLI